MTRLSSSPMTGGERPSIEQTATKAVIELPSERPLYFGSGGCMQYFRHARSTHGCQLQTPCWWHVRTFWPHASDIAICGFVARTKRAEASLCVCGDTMSIPNESLEVGAAQTLEVRRERAGESWLRAVWSRNRRADEKLGASTRDAFGLVARALSEHLDGLLTFTP